MVPIFSSYPIGTILSRTKPICSKRMRRLISFSFNYMLGKRYISYTYNYTRTLSAFPCGRIQYVRRMPSDSCVRYHTRVLAVIFQVISVLPFSAKTAFCDRVSFGIIPSSVKNAVCCPQMYSPQTFPSLIVALKLVML